jgi:OmpA-OmpF porin, OOP family
MKNLLFIISLFLLTSVSYGQIDILSKVKDKVINRADRKTDETIDKGLDAVEEDMKGENKEENEEEVQGENEKPELKKTEVQQEKKAGLKAYSKYDFISGEKTLYFEDFTQDNIGEFPLKWNTNSGGEVVELEGLGKWFMPNWGGTFYPENLGPLPDNFTIEFDLIYDLGGETGGPPVVVDIISTLPDEPMDNLVPGSGGVEFTIDPNSVSFKNWANQSYGEISMYRENDILSKMNQLPVRISMMIQKQRMRIWVNETKVADLPKMMPAGMIFDRIRFFEWGSETENAKFYIKNFRVAAGIPDMRSKLLTEGKLVTHGIYFDSGSDKIKPESYGTLKEIAKVLSENSGVKVNIIGHTDSDGADASNLELSKKRSLSVKNILSSEFGIDASRMETDGMGESQPMDINTTPEGKANNRRVEFIKI